MEDEKQTSFTFDIDNFWEMEDVISSPNFISGGCEWFLEVYPKGQHRKDDFTLSLCVANLESLRLGWKIRASYSFVLLNQSGKELYKTNSVYERRKLLFKAQLSKWCISTALKTLQEKGVFTENKLIVKVEVKVLEVVDEGAEDEMLDFNGFQILSSQIVSVNRLYMEHPGFADNFRLTNQSVGTIYMNILLGVIDTLNKPPDSLSFTELRNAYSELVELTTAGFKLDWLKTIFNDVSLEWEKENAGEVALERKKENANWSQVEELEEQFTSPNIELNNEKVTPATSATTDTDWLEDVVDSLNKWKWQKTGRHGEGNGRRRRHGERNDGRRRRHGERNGRRRRHGERGIDKQVRNRISCICSIGITEYEEAMVTWLVSSP